MIVFLLLVMRLTRSASRRIGPVASSVVFEQRIPCFWTLSFAQLTSFVFPLCAVDDDDGPVSRRGTRT